MSRPAPPPPDNHAALVALMQAGRLPEAERLCRQSLAGRPSHPERFHYALGFILMARDNPAEAATALRQAVKVAPSYAEAHHALFFALKRLGDDDGAAAALVQAAGCPGAGAEIHCNLGLFHRERGENRRAIVALRHATSLDPRLSSAWLALGASHRALNEIEEAIAAFRRAVESDERNPSSYLALGTLLLDLARPDALEPLARAATLDSGSATIAERHARALALAQRFDDALREHERACALAPGSGACLLSKARTLAESGQADAADGLCRQLIESKGASAPDKALAHHELADRALARGDVAAARASLDAALMLAPASNDIRLRRAMLLLSLGEFDPGWREFEARFAAGIEKGGIGQQPFPQPRWRGEDISGSTILVWGEQGIGDDILAASMLPGLAARARRVLVHTDARLQPLFARSFPANVEFFPRVLPVQERLLSNEVSCHAPLGGLAEFLRPSWSSFGTPRAFLQAASVQTDEFRDRYAALPGLKVGISWRSRNLVNGRMKSTELGDWTSILRLPGVSFVNLQYGDCEDDLVRASTLSGVDIFNDPDVDQLRDLDTFAAQISALDLVISVSNATAHMAGALGVPTWVLLSTDPLWVWFRERDDSPWYPHVRLFRQTRTGDWGGPISGVATALKAWLQSK